MGLSSGEKNKVLALTFFVSVFSTVFWLIYAIMFVSDKLHGVPLNALGLMDASIYAAFIILPVFLLWSIFGYINQYLYNKNMFNNLHTLFKQMKKNMDYTDLVARIMLEAEQEIKDGFILNKFDIFIADMNEILSEIIRRSGIASSEQIENLWAKVQNGGKWSFGKVLIEVSQNQADFQLRIFNKTQKDVVLSGSVLEFAARYQSLASLLEKHDKERVFLNLIETGVFGKVFSILAPVADEIKRVRENSGNLKPKAPVFSREENKTVSFVEPEIMQEDIRTSSIAESSQLGRSGSIVSKFKIFRKKEDAAEPVKTEPVVFEEEKDPFTVALERSFGARDEDKAPQFTEPRLSSFSEEEIPVPKIKPEDTAPLIRNEVPMREEEQLDIEDFTGHVQIKQSESESKIASFDETQKTLSSLRKEWETMKKPAEPQKDEEEEKEESYSYPFGSWTDEANYKK